MQGDPIDALANASTVGSVSEVTSATQDHAEPSQCFFCVAALQVDPMEALAKASTVGSLSAVFASVAHVSVLPSFEVSFCAEVHEGTARSLARSTQLESDWEPRGLILPTAQSLQPACPATSCHLPATQVWHADAAPPLDLPAAQFWHVDAADAAVAALCLPAAQSLQPDSSSHRARGPLNAAAGQHQERGLRGRRC